MSAERRRAVRPVLAWVAAAVAAVAVASWGVALVGRSVTDSRPAPLSAAQVSERLDAATSTSVPPSSTTETTAPATSTTLGETSPSTPAGDPGGTPATTAAPPPPPPPPSTTAPPAGETRTYALVGGTATLRFEPTGVTVVVAKPAPGFEVEYEPEHVNGVRVEFESESHRSRVTGWWDGGPQERVEEQPDSDDGDDD